MLFRSKAVSKLWLVPLLTVNVLVPVISAVLYKNGGAGAESDIVTVMYFLVQSRSREKIVWFPKIYYQMEKGLLHIRCEITMGKYQDQLLRLEDKLESGLYCELTDKTLHDGYIEYTLLYDMIANRITIDEVRAENRLVSKDLLSNGKGTATYPL